jgi:hypothetical protein
MIHCGGYVMRAVQSLSNQQGVLRSEVPPAVCFREGVKVTDCGNHSGIELDELPSPKLRHRPRQMDSQSTYLFIVLTNTFGLAVMPE